MILNLAHCRYNMTIFLSSLRHPCLFLFSFLLLIPSLSFGQTGPGLNDIPHSIICLECETPGNSRSPSYAVLVEKASQTLTLYSFNGSYQKELSVDCSTGEIPGPKLVSGDKKTPEGIYFFKSKFEKKYLSDTYGELAFPMDYPNLPDRLQEKNGNSIWMHGTNKPLKARDSNGCIVLENSGILKLAQYIRLNKTPIIIEQQVNVSPVEERNELITQLITFLSNWNDALQSGTYHDYMSFYDTGFIPDISWWQRWQEIKQDALIKIGQEASTEMEDISMFRHNGLYVARFIQFITSKNHRFHVGSKKLYIKTSQENDDRHFSIAGDVFQPDVIKKETAVTPFMAALKQINTTINFDREIIGLINDWRLAWSSKDITSYADYYSGDFFSNGMNLTAWLNKKRRLNKRYDYINVSIGNLEIEKGRKFATATFDQRYESNAFRAVGEKKLILKIEDGRWKIYREIWKKK